MRLERIILKNIYQHRDLDLTFEGSVIGFTGENGNGKSNLLAAIGESVHGDFHQNKDRVVTWGQEEGSMHSFFSLPDGTRFDVLRELPGGAATLKSGTTKITGPTKVNAWILDKLGMDKSALTNFVFVDQTAITDILFAKPTEKQRIAQRFFNLSGATIIEAGITKGLSDLSLDSMADRLPTFNAELIGANEHMKEAERAASGLRLSTDVEAEIAAADARIEYGSRLNGVLSTLAVLRGALQTDTAAYQVETRDYTTRYQAYMAVDNVANAALWPGLLEASRNGARWLEQMQITNAALAKAEADLAGLRPCPYSDEFLEGRQAELTGLASKVSVFEARIAELVEHLNGIGTNEKCPTCGSKIDISSRPQIEAQLIEVRASLAGVKGPAYTISEGLKAQWKERNAWGAESVRLSNEVKRLRTEKENAGMPPPSNPEPEKYEKLIKDREAERQALATMHGNLTERKKRMDETERKIAQESGGFSAAELAQSPVPVVEIQAKVKELRAEATRISEAEEKIRSTSAKVETLRNQIKEAREAEESNTLVKTARVALEKVRAVFHPSGAPRTVITRSNRLIESRINHYLGMMNSKFTVRALDGFNFEATFSHGIGYDTELSVGQKTALAWAFRLAGCETFSASAGFMTLDEPSAPMSKEVLKGFLDVIGVLKQLASSNSMQFMIATHAPEIVRECDQTFEIK